MILKINASTIVSGFCDLNPKVLVQSFPLSLKIHWGFKIDSRFTQSMVSERLGLSGDQRGTSSIRRVCDCYQEQCTSTDLYAVGRAAHVPRCNLRWRRDFHSIRSGTLLYYQGCIPSEHRLESYRKAEKASNSEMHVILPLSIRMAMRNGQSMAEANKQRWIDFQDQRTNRQNCLTLSEWVYRWYLCLSRNSCFLAGLKLERLWRYLA